jgi:hypothetical protein
LNIIKIKIKSLGWAGVALPHPALNQSVPETNPVVNANVQEKIDNQVITTDSKDY